MFHGHRGQRQPGPHGGGRRPQRQYRVALGVHPGTEDDLAVVLDQAVSERPQPGTARPRPQPPGGHRLAGPADGGVHGVRDGAPGLGDGGEQLVGVGEPAGDGHGILFGEQQPVQVPAGHRLQRVPDVEQLGVCLVDGAVRAVGDPAGRQRAQDGDIAQPAAGLLQIGFEQVGRLAVALAALGQGVQQLRQPAPDATAPVPEQGGAGAHHQRPVAGQRAQVEQADARGQVDRRHLAALVGGAHRVVEPQPRVPQRVPQPLGQGRHPGLAVSAAVVHEHEVEVAGGPGLTAGHAADDGQRDAGGTGRQVRGQLLPVLLRHGAAARRVARRAGQRPAGRGEGLGHRLCPGQRQRPLDHQGEFFAALRPGRRRAHREGEPVPVEVTRCRCCGPAQIRHARPISRPSGLAVPRRHRPRRARGAAFLHRDCAAPCPPAYASTRPAADRCRWYGLCACGSGRGRGRSRTRRGRARRHGGPGLRLTARRPRAPRCAPAPRRPRGWSTPCRHRSGRSGPP